MIANQQVVPALFQLTVDVNHFFLLILTRISSRTTTQPSSFQHLQSSYTPEISPLRSHALHASTHCCLYFYSLFSFLLHPKRVCCTRVPPHKAVHIKLTSVFKHRSQFIQSLSINGRMNLVDDLVLASEMGLYEQQCRASCFFFIILTAVKRV